MSPKCAIPILSLILLSHCAYAQAKTKYVAHEWGTFTSVVASNGVTQNGLFHEDEALPAFVHGFGDTNHFASTNVSLQAIMPPNGDPDPTPEPAPAPPPHFPCHSKACFGQAELRKSLITQKMETPVIYFYADQAVNVDVSVKFPQGIITETYPGPVSTFPTMSDPHIIANGKSLFSVSVLPQKTATLPFVDADNIYGHARAVASNILRSGNETEKFIFYRGLGRFQPKISITSRDGNLKIGRLSSARPQAAFLVHVNESGDGQLVPLPSVKTAEQILISSKDISLLRDHAAMSSFVLRGSKARNALIMALTQSGLFKDEATAMVNTWEHGYLKVPGLRLLYVLPQAEVDEVLPLSMTPAPENLVRSFVGRMEILLDTDEQKTLQEIALHKNQFPVTSLGRFAEPILNRMKDLAQEKDNSAELLRSIDFLMGDASLDVGPAASVH